MVHMLQYQLAGLECTTTTTSGLIIGGHHIIYRILNDDTGPNSLHEQLSTSPSSPKILHKWSHECPIPRLELIDQSPQIKHEITIISPIDSKKVLANVPRKKTH